MEWAIVVSILHMSLGILGCRGGKITGSQGFRRVGTRNLGRVKVTQVRILKSGPKFESWHLHGSPNPESIRLAWKCSTLGKGSLMM
ncbi:hypothetical protein Ancab_016198, partial [Ancistrocladus abbreviatus]